MKRLISRPQTLVAGGVMLGVLAFSACSGGGSGSEPGGQGGVIPQSTAAGGSSGGLGGITATGGSGAGGTSGSGGSTGTSPFANVGVCGARGKATADETSFEGYEERYIIGEQGFGSHICVVRFALKRVADAPAGCTECVWAHLLEYTDPSVVTDTDGVCVQSDLALDMTAIATIVGSRVAMGFAAHLGGAHGSARMTYFEDKQLWDVAGNANWSETTKTFSYDDRQGLCNYGP